MITDQTAEGWEARLRPHGAGRFLDAAFLAVWLCGWLVGEMGALVILGAGGWALATGQSPGSDGAPLAPAKALAMGLFLVVWLLLWTVGGVAAARQLLRVLWSEDRLIARPDRLRIVRRVGPFLEAREIARSELRGVYRIASGTRLMVATREGRVELTHLGTPAELAALELELQRALALDRGDANDAPIGLPEDWEEIQARDGATLLVRALAVRRGRARFAWLVTTIVSCLALTLVSLDQEAGSLALACVATVVAAAIGGATWLTIGRHEWKLEPHRMILRRRLGSRIRPLFEGVALALESESDSDGDDWYQLVALASDSDSPILHEPRKLRRTVLRRIHDPSDPRRLGAWLAGRTSLALHDRTTPEAKAAESAALIARLAATGAFGRWAARRLERIAARRFPR